MYQDRPYQGGPRRRSASHRLSVLEWATLLHVGTLAVAATWAAGAQADWVRTALAWWGSLGGLITLAAALERADRRDGRRHAFTWLGPLLAFNAVVIAGTFNPGFREVLVAGETRIAPLDPRPGWPSSAFPGRSLQALWIFDAIWIACFNLALVIRQRRALRGLLLVVVTNALVLAAFGTVQKLTGATWWWFSPVASPPQDFFATFASAHHWGALAILMTAAGIGLTWHYMRRGDTRGGLYSPAMGGWGVIALLTLTIPLSGSISCTLLALLLLGGAFGYWIASLIRRRRHFHESIIPPLCGGLVALVLTAGATWWAAGDLLRPGPANAEARAAVQATDTPGAPVAGAADTWHLVQAKPWFGWGMAAHPGVLAFLDTQDPRAAAGPRAVGRDHAPADGLRMWAEHGLIGSILLGACALLPLVRLRPRHINSAIARFLFLGCGLLLVEAWIASPLGNLAIVVCWWLLFFTGVQYSRLQPERSSDTAAP